MPTPLAYNRALFSLCFLQLRFTLARELAILAAPLQHAALALIFAHGLSKNAMGGARQLSNGTPEGRNGAAVTTTYCKTVGCRGGGKAVPMQTLP